MRVCVGGGGGGGGHPSGPGDLLGFNSLNFSNSISSENSIEIKGPPVNTSEIFGTLARFYSPKTLLK